MSSEQIILIVVFAFIAMVYASVGFGGGTSYLALMGYLAVDFQIMRPTALICNIVVVTGGTYIFYKNGKLDLKRCWPFILASVPLAYLGGYYPIREKSFFIILGITLIVAAFLLWFQENIRQLKTKSINPDNIALNLGLGGGIGFLSGLVSIGGGIFLSPILHLLNWDEAKKISALASLFILVNSISGLAGQISRSATIDWKFVWPLILAVLVGGQIGSRFGAEKFNALYIKRITAVLILVAGVNILNRYLDFF
ncbi:MAG TPA: sulfite exporter TauE/SafE family protein [Cyclobacteriaceae bacterium]|nr:sulfite exporter TauE/SafE family protein [Cyclobacteriaceae bacterium]